ncbi:MAG: sulfatase-like hydrolase/transferase [Acidimicrobiales bacterium]
MLTGRNHHAVGFGQIPEYATDFDGYVGEIPRSASTIAEVLGAYGYATAAFGKWHNTPINQVSRNGPFERWPTGHGFDYFYGFLAGETSQYEPRLFENATPIEPPDDPDYHLTEDLADKAIAYLRRHRNTTPDEPVLIYFTPGAAHGAHRVPNDWADRYAGVFDDGWEVLRERTFERQKELGWIPTDAVLTPIDPTMQRWADIPEEQRRFQARLMEVYAGFAEHTDHQYGKVLSELDRLGELDNTLVFYVNSDNGASAEGLFGTISEILCQNGLMVPVSEQIDILDRDYGGLPSLGTEMVGNRYHAGWAWASDTPFKSTKLVAAHFGGTRTPLAVAWPRGFDHDPTPPIPVPPRDRHRGHHLRRPRYRPAGPVQRGRSGPDRRGLPRPVPARCGRIVGTDHPVLRDHGQPGRLPRRLVRRRVRTPQPVGSGLQPVPGRGPGPGRVGAVRPAGRLQPGPRPGRPGPRQAGRAAGHLRRARRSQSGVPDRGRAPHLGVPARPDAVIRPRGMGVRRRLRSDPRIAGPEIPRWPLVPVDRPVHRRARHRGRPVLCGWHHRRVHRVPRRRFRHRGIQHGRGRPHHRPGRSPHRRRRPRGGRRADHGQRPVPGPSRSDHRARRYPGGRGAGPPDRPRHVQLLRDLRRGQRPRLPRVPGVRPSQPFAFTGTIHSVVCRYLHPEPR